MVGLSVMKNDLVMEFWRAGTEDINLVDRRFLEIVSTDIQSFIRTLSSSSVTKERKVLSFPPVNNYRRFLIHQLVCEKFSAEQLSTVSIGRQDSRRIIIYPTFLKKTDSNEVEFKKSSVKIKNTTTFQSDTRMRRTRKPDMPIYVPRGRRQTSSPSETTPEKLNNVSRCSSNSDYSKRSSILLNNESNVSSTLSKSTIIDETMKIDVTKENEVENHCDNVIDVDVISISDSNSDDSIIFEDTPTKQNSLLNSPPNSTFNPDNLLYSTPSEKSPTISCTNDSNKSDVFSDLDWDEMFDDNGDYVDKSLMHELMNQFGKVYVQKTEQDYSPFQTMEERSNDGECLLEVYGFPMEFKTDDLTSIFHAYRGNPRFQIVWVDDTHALAMFPSPSIADEVLNTTFPSIKIRPLKNAIPQSRIKARYLVVQPSERPKTCVSLARRLVSGHLGMRIDVTDKQKQAERKLLADARAKKRQVNKQKIDMWDAPSSSFE